jgi:hypothetical protein
MSAVTADHIARRYQDWETLMRRFIAQAEERRLLGPVEVAKALLLEGMKLNDELLASDVVGAARLAVINGMRRRCGVVLQHALADERDQ